MTEEPPRNLSDPAHALHLNVREALAHLVKAALVSDPARARAWEEQALVYLQQARAAQNSGTHAHLTLNGVWYQAVGEAESDVVVQREETVKPVLPQACPFTLDELLAPGFDLDKAAQRIRESAATG